MCRRPDLGTVCIRDRGKNTEEGCVDETAGGRPIARPSILEGVLGVEVVEGLLDAGLHGLLALADPDTRVGVFCEVIRGNGSDLPPKI